MKNTKLSVGLIACLLSVGGLAGCSKVKSSSEGVLLRYTIGSDKYEITADDILERSYDDSSKYQAIFDIIYSVLVKNYFNESYSVNYYGTQVTLGKEQMGTKKDPAKSEGSIYARAKQKVEEDKETARTNADANNTRYKKELETILNSNGVSTIEELEDKYVEEIQKETFEKNFYTNYIEDLKLGAGATVRWGQSADTSLKDFWPGYIEDQAPYHVSHILVKLEDGSGTNYADGTISEANAKKLYNVVNALATSEDSFSTIAKQFSEDTGSRVVSGDLGIMDASTSFVNEFKLGVYAYENYYSKQVKTGSTINASEFETKYSNAVKESFSKDELVGNDKDIPVISSEVFSWLKDAAETDENDESSKVLDNKAAFYPRNIIYNKYLNRHSVAFISGPADNSEGKTHGFHTFGGKLEAAGPILAVKVAGEWQPVLCVRAGSDYQGIHFIVINRSPFKLEGADADKVSLSNYYTTFYPDQKDYYPKNASGVQLNTYINFSSINSDVSATKKRAEELASKLKSFDSDRLSKYIFKKFMIEEGVKINQSKLETSLDKWIETSIDKAEEERDEKWSKTWNEYIDTLARQGSERSKLIPQACRIGYTTAYTASETKTLMTVLKENNGDVGSALFNLVKGDLASLGWKDSYVVGLETKNIDFSATTLTDEEVEAYFEYVTIKHAFKDKGGLCNDGESHL